MKIFKSSIFFILFLCLFCNAKSKCVDNTDIKIEIINSESLSVNYYASKESQKIINLYTQKIESKAKELKKISVKDYNKFINQNLSTNGNLIKFNKRLTTTMVDTINKFIENYCDNNNLDFLFDIKLNLLVYYNENKYNINKNDKLDKRKMKKRFGICEIDNFKDVTELLLKQLNDLYSKQPYLNDFEIEVNRIKY